MRHLVFALLIALLPLRGWVGDAMALQLTVAALSHTEIAIKKEAFGAIGTSASSHFEHQTPAVHAAAEPPAMAHADCPGHDSSALPASPHHGGGAQHADGDCASCTTCQICHSVALTPVLLHFTSALLPATAPSSKAPHFASAERAPGFKPPIS